MGKTQREDYELGFIRRKAFGKHQGEERGRFEKFFIFLLIPIWGPIRLVYRMVRSFVRLLIFAFKTLWYMLCEIKKVTQASNIETETHGKEQYQVLAEKWGIVDESTRRQARAIFRFHFFCSMLFFLLGAFLLYRCNFSSFLDVFNTAWVLVVGIVGALISLWKITLVEDQNYTSLLNWLTNK